MLREYHSWWGKQKIWNDMQAILIYFYSQMGREIRIFLAFLVFLAFQEH